MHTHNREKVGEVIDQMVDYTLTHFAFEEEMMEKAGYKILPRTRQSTRLLPAR